MEVTIKVDVEFATDEWSNVNGIEVNISKADLDLIERSREFMKANPMLNKVCISTDADPVGDDDVRSDYAELRIYPGQVYVYCQSKYDAGTQWEGTVDLDEVKKKMKLEGYINNL